MKNLVALITLIFLTLATHIYSGVGDVYYCTSDTVIYYEPKKKQSFIYPKTVKFNFKWTKKFDHEYIEFGDSFTIGNFKMDKVEAFGDNYFKATTGSSSADILLFDNGSFHFSSLYSNFQNQMIHATCDKF